MQKHAENAENMNRKVNMNMNMLTSMDLPAWPNARITAMGGKQAGGSTESNEGGSPDLTKCSCITDQARTSHPPKT